MSASRFSIHPLAVILESPQRTLYTAMLVAAASWLINVTCHSQEVTRTGPVASGDHRFLGVERCEDCHREPTATRIERGVTNFVTLTESKTWLSDVHSRAYALIDPAQSELSRQICDKLQIADISQARQCLSCHANWLPDRERPPTYQRGVACESCHGPSEHWDVPHSREDWRAKPVTEKESLGMVDVRNPTKRAEQCLSCHIGSVADGKVVTHEMYAAGHPPLPSIEIESFARQMPRHWRYLAEKPAFTFRDEFVRENHRYLLPEATASTAQVAKHHHGAAAVVLGGVLALRESIELLGDMAARPEPAWPELSVLNCAACHHELATPGWRQENIRGAAPGRPSMHTWPTALTRLAILHIAPDRATYDRQLAEFNSKLDAVGAAFHSSPFGKPDELQSACASLSDWLTNEMVVPVAAKPFDPRSLQRSIGLLVHIGSTETHDYDSARQIAWALRTLHCELKPTQGADEPVHKLLADLSAELRLNLPNGPPDFCAPITPADLSSRELVALTSGLSANLQTAAAYNPENFRKQMQAIKEAMTTPQ